MTVEELIKNLKELPPKMEVYLQTKDNDDNNTLSYTNSIFKGADYVLIRSKDVNDN